MRFTDFHALLLALGLHAALGVGVWVLSKRPPPPPPQWVRVEVRKREPPPKLETPPPEPERPEPPPPPKKPKAPRTTAPIPNQETPKRPPAEPPKPVFGATAESTTTGPSDFSVPVGNTTTADPKTANPKVAPQPLPAAPPQAAPGPPAFKAASALEIKDTPDIDNDSCHDGLPYPDAALEAGIQGDVFLRVQIDEHAKVVGVRLIGKGLGYGLNEASIKAMKQRCKITSPAVNLANKPVPSEITYKFTWALSS